MKNRQINKNKSRIKCKKKYLELKYPKFGPLRKKKQMIQQFNNKG